MDIRFEVYGNLLVMSEPSSFIQNPHFHSLDVGDHFSVLYCLTGNASKTHSRKNHATSKE